jgi:cell division septum initiation protein DivIVA
MGMLRRADTTTVSNGRPARDPGAGSFVGRPNVTGDIEDLLGTAPSFRSHWRGYDRLQVDNYVTWAESELVAARREADHLLSRYGTTSAELEHSRRLLAETPKSRDLSAVSARVAEILRLAGDEAAATVDAAGQEADQTLAAARREADARLRNAQQVEEAAVAASYQLREQAQAQRAEAQAERAEATAALEDARAQAENLLRDAQAEHVRITGELVEARAQLAVVQAEVDDLQGERDAIRELLCVLTERIGQALTMVTGGTDERFVVVGNRAQAVPS